MTTIRRAVPGCASVPRLYKRRTISDGAWHVQLTDTGEIVGVGRQLRDGALLALRDPPRYTSSSTVCAAP